MTSFALVLVAVEKLVEPAVYLTYVLRHTRQACHAHGNGSPALGAVHCRLHKGAASLLGHMADSGAMLGLGPSLDAISGALGEAEAGPLDRRVVASLQAVCRAAHAMGAADNNPGAEAQARAKAWMHVGLAQALLMVPPNGVDPAQRCGVKRAHAVERAADLAADIETRIQIERLVSGASDNLMVWCASIRFGWRLPLVAHYSPMMVVGQPPGAQIRGRAAARDEALHTADRLASKVMLRPVPGQFPAVHAQVARFMASVGSDVTVTSLCDALVGCLEGHGNVEQVRYTTKNVHVHSGGRP
jgi:hypothetical protein